MPPYAVRVRTATGWQDIALTGPPGATGATGPQGTPGAPGPAPLDMQHYTFSQTISGEVALNLTREGTTYSQSSGDTAQYSVSSNRITIRDPGIYLVCVWMDTGAPTDAYFYVSSAFVTLAEARGAGRQLASAGIVYLPSSGANYYVDLWGSRTPSGAVSGRLMIARLVQGAKGDPSTVPGPMGTVNPYQIGQTWGVGGVLTAGMIIPVIFAPKRSNQSVTIVGARAMIQSGTSVGVQLTRNGTAVGGVMTVTTTPSLVSFTQALSDGDRLGLVTSAPVGSPSDMSYTVLLEHTAT